MVLPAVCKQQMHLQSTSGFDQAMTATDAIMLAVRSHNMSVCSMHRCDLQGSVNINMLLLVLNASAILGMANVSRTAVNMQLMIIMQLVHHKRADTAVFLTVSAFTQRVD